MYYVHDMLDEYIKYHTYAHNIYDKYDSREHIMYVCIHTCHSYTYYTYHKHLPRPDKRRLSAAVNISCLCVYTYIYYISSISQAPATCGQEKVKHSRERVYVLFLSTGPASNSGGTYTCIHIYVCIL